MGPGSENVVIQYNQNHQKVSPSGKSKGKNGSNNGHHQQERKSSNNKGSWFYEEMKKTTVLAANESTGVKCSNNQSPPNKGGKKSSAKKNQNLTASHPQYHAKSKPIPVARSISQNEVGGQQQRYSAPIMKGTQMQCASPRQRPISLTPPNVVSQSLLLSTPTSSSTQCKGTPGKVFYAGAKFETHPPIMVLPRPPNAWTTPIQRSHSQPSTPTIKSGQNGTAIDLASLFGSPITNPVAIHESLMQALVEKNQDSVESDSSDEELKEILSEGTKKAINNKKEAVPSISLVQAQGSNNPRPIVNTEDLKKALGMIMANSTSAAPVTSDSKSEPESRSVDPWNCHGSLTPLKNFQEMSDQLKSLMKVAA